MYCGGERDSDGLYCTKCRGKDREKRKARIEYHAARGLCPYCGKEKLFGDEKCCPECRAKKIIANVKWMNGLKEKGRRRKLTSNNARKVAYQRAKDNNLCPKCRKRKPKPGYVMCEMCLTKVRNYRAQKYIERGGFPRSERVERGLCYICGDPLDQDKTICKKCTEKLRNRPRKSGEKGKHPWTATNTYFFKKY